MRISHRVVLLAGPSGSGKSYIARRTGLPVLCLDDFYKDGDDPTLPRRNGHGRLGVARVLGRRDRGGRPLPDWPGTGKAEVPVYAIGADRRVATRPFDLAGSPLFVAEGIFAAEIVDECRRRGLLAGAYALRRPRGATFVRRLARDLAEQRKAPRVLLRRGVRAAARRAGGAAPADRAGRRGGPGPGGPAPGGRAARRPPAPSADQPISFAYAGLITSLMIASRSSNGMNALFIALMVNHCSSAQP